MLKLLAFVLVLAGTDPKLVGTWGMGGDGNLVFKADGTGTLDGDAFKWSVKGNVLTVTYPEEDGADQMTYQVKGDQLAIAMAGIPMTFQRVGKAPKATSKTAATSDAPAATADAGAPKPKKAGSDKLSKLLLSSAWCSFSYKGGSTYAMSYGTTSTSRVQFFADGTFSYSSGSESGNSGPNGTYAGASSGGARGQWQVKDNDLWIYLPPQFPTLTKTNTQVNYNSNGYPILKGGDGTEYMLCK